MPWQYTPYAAPVFLSAVLGLGMAAFAWHHRERPGAAPLAVLMIGASLWSFAEAMNLSHADLAGKILWTRAEIALSGIVPIAFLALVLEYTGNDRWVRPSVFGLLSVEPVAVAVLVVTNPTLFRTSIAITTVDSYRVITEQLAAGFYLHVIYSYLLVLVGAALLVRVIVFADGLYRAQSTALLFAAFVPSVGNVMYLFEVLPAGMDPTGIGFLFTGFIVAGAVLRRQLLEVVPVAREVAREEIIDNMDDRVVVLDDRGHVVDMNPAAADLLDCEKREVIGQSLASVFPELAERLGESDDRRFGTELTMENDGGWRYYDVRVSPLEGAGGVVAGELVSLRDVTERRQRRQRLDVLNRLLRHNLRNEMNVIAGNAELVADELSDSSLERRVADIRETATKITDRSDKVGRMTRSLEDTDRRALDLAAVVRDETQRARAQFPDARFEVDVPETLRIEGTPAISVAIGELLANAVEHNDHPATVELTTTWENGTAVVRITDDGPGIDENELTVLESGTETALKHGSGLGLWVVNWVVRQSGGSVEFTNGEPGPGCTATVRLPRVVETDDGDGSDDGDDSADVSLDRPPTGSPVADPEPADD